MSEEARPPAALPEPVDLPERCELATDCGHIESSDHRPSALRFSLRSLLMVSFVVALVAAAVGGYCRQLSADQAQRVGALWTGAFVGGIGWAVVWTLRRYRAEHRAGRPLFCMPVTFFGFPRFARVLQLPVMCLVIAWAAWGLIGMTLVAGRTAFSGNLATLYIGGGTFAFVFIYEIIAIRWNRAAWLCEHGVLRGSGLERWRHWERYYWHRRHRDVLIVVGLLRRVVMIVPPQQQDMVETLLREKLTAPQSRPGSG